MTNKYIPPEHNAKAPITVSSVGFQFGPLDVQRVTALPDGGVAVRLETQTSALNISVTGEGVIDITSDAGIDFLPNTTEMMQWIPVSDRLPNMSPDAEGFPASADVLVAFKDGACGVASVYHIGDEPTWSDDCDSDLTQYVTHWIPLPPVPDNAMSGAKPAR